MHLAYMYQNLFAPVQHLRRPVIKPGGICWMVFAKREDVLRWPVLNPANSIAITTISLKEGKTWYQAQSPDKNFQFNEELKVADSGPYWEQSIPFYIPGNSSNLTLSAAAIPYHEYVVMLKDRDGQIRMIGNEDRGADLLPAYTSGDFDNSRRWDYKFVWQHINPATIYIASFVGILDEVIPTPFNGQGEFNNDFNKDFNL